MTRSGRGYEDDARDRVVDAARRSGVSVSDLVKALADAPRPDASRPAARRGRRDEPQAGDLDAQLDELSARLKRLTGTERTRTPVRPARARSDRDRFDRDPGQEATLDEIASTVDRLSRTETLATRRPGRRSERDPDGGRILEALDGLDRRVRALAEDRAAPARERRPDDDRARARRAREAVDDLDRVMSDMAERRPSRRDERPDDRRTDDLERHFRTLGEKIDGLRLRDDRDATASLIGEIRSLREFIETRAGFGADVSGEIRRLTGKIDDVVAHRPERALIEPLMTEIGRLRDVVLQTNVEGSLKSLEVGYGHIVDRLDDLKRGLAGPRVEAKVDAEISEIHNLLRAVPQVSQFSALERHLRDLADKVDGMAGRGDDDEPTRALERRIAEMKAQLDEIDPSAVVRALDQRLKLVSDKLDDIDRAARGPVAPERLVALVDELRTIAAGSRTAEAVRDLEGRLGELADRITEFDRRRPSFDDTDRLHERIAEIAGKLDQMTAPSAPDRRTVEALEAAIGRLDEMMARPPAAGLASDRLDQRFDALFDRLDRDDRAPSSTAEVEALTREIAAMRREITASRSTGELEAQMRLLAERLERSTTHEPDDETLGQIEDQLARITRQLDATQDRFQDLTTLEGHIRRLAERIEDQQIDAVAAAREAAREMVREIGQAQSGGGASEAVLRALQDDLKSLQSAARDTESRTNDTLISLHDALTGIVGRLTAIEKIAQGSARSAAAARSAAQAAENAVQAQVQPAPVAPVQAPAVAAVQPAPMPPMPPVEPAVQPTIAGKPATATGAVARARELLASAAATEDSRPLEPGSGKPLFRAAAPQTAAAPVAAAPVAAVHDGAAPPAAARKADFIAAARRAAQAAAAATVAPAPLAAQPEDRAAPLAAEDEAPAAGGPLARIGQVLKNRRRPLVLATAAIVLAILSLRILQGGDEPAPQISALPPAPAPVVATAPQVAPPVASASTTFTKPAPGEIVTNSVPRAPAPTRVTPSMLAPAPTAVTEPETVAPKPTSLAPSTMATPAPQPYAAQPYATQSSAPEAAPPAPPAAPIVSAMPPQSAPVPPSPAPGFAAPQAPAPAAALSSQPDTTGSIPPLEAQMPKPSAGETVALPDKIGSEKLRRAAEAGDTAAAFEVGLRYAEGRGIPADLARAADWYGKAAAKGLVPAQYRLAIAYEKGLGVERNAEQAKRLYLAAAEKGNVRAMHNLGVLFANARDMNSAVPWFQKAGDLGLKDSQFNLGIIHALGSGVKQDLAVSYKWFALAAKQGDQEAEKKLQEVASHLDKVNLAAARMAVQTWVQRPVDRVANDESQVWNEPAPPVVQGTPFGRDTVVQAQQMLKAKGLYGGAVDGEMSTATRAAIRSFQKKVGQAATGDLDPALMKALGGKAM